MGGERRLVQRVCLQVPKTRNPKLETRAPSPHNRNPKPGTRNPSVGREGPGWENTSSGAESGLVALGEESDDWSSASALVLLNHPNPTPGLR